MPPGQSALNVEIQVDTTALAAKLQAAVQQAVAAQLKSGMAAGQAVSSKPSPTGLTGVPVPAPTRTQLPTPVGSPPAAWSPPTVSPSPSLVVVPGPTGGTRDARAIESKLRAAIRGQTRAAIAGAVVASFSSLGTGLNTGDTRLDELGESFGRIIGTAGSAALFSGGNPFIAALAGFTVLVTEVVDKAGDRLNLIGKEAREEQKRLEGRIKLFQEAQENVFIEARERAREFKQELMEIREGLRDDRLEELYQASRSVPYE